MWYITIEATLKGKSCGGFKGIVIDNATNSLKNYCWRSRCKKNLIGKTGLLGN